MGLYLTQTDVQKLAVSPACSAEHPQKSSDIASSQGCIHIDAKLNLGCLAQVWGQLPQDAEDIQSLHVQLMY